MKTLLLENIHPIAQKTLEANGLPVTVRKGSFGEEELIASVRDVSVLGIRSRTEITKRVLEHAPHLLVIGAYCIGTNQIDLEAASLHGVAVFNAPFSNTRSVASW